MSFPGRGFEKGRLFWEVKDVPEREGISVWIKADTSKANQSTLLSTFEAQPFASSRPSPSHHSPTSLQKVGFERPALTPMPRSAIDSTFSMQIVLTILVSQAFREEGMEDATTEAAIQEGGNGASR